jgi:hypothetical protein
MSNNYLSAKAGQLHALRLFTICRRIGPALVPLTTADTDLFVINLAIGLLRILQNIASVESCMVELWSWIDC